MTETESKLHVSKRNTRRISQDIGHEQQAHKTGHCRSEEFGVKMIKGGAWVVTRLVLRKDRGQNIQGSDRSWSSSLTPPQSPLRAMWVHMAQKWRYESKTWSLLFKCWLDFPQSPPLLKWADPRTSPKWGKGCKSWEMVGTCHYPRTGVIITSLLHLVEDEKNVAIKSKIFREIGLTQGPAQVIMHFCPQTQLRW